MRLSGIVERPIYRAGEVKRWQASGPQNKRWDGLRRDEELWYSTGCRIYLYGRDQSLRGPSFRIPVEALRRKQCGPLLRQIVRIPPEASDETVTSPNGDTLELYLGVPQGLSRDQVFRFQLTTRNFFAWLLHKPLVGQHLGPVLIDLLERMRDLRSPYVNNVEDVLEYCAKMGYMEFVNRPDYALSMLFFAEKCHLRHLWIETFSHCVGMNYELSKSTEFDPIRQSLRHTIIQTALEMKLSVDHRLHAVYTFLEEQLAPANTGLTDPARLHLETFKSFLNSYCIGRSGYWPPAREETFPKRLIESLYQDFRSLYILLADKNEDECAQNRHLQNGALCVHQCISTLDEREGFEPLPHTLPLLPKLPPQDIEASTWSSRRLLGRVGIKQKHASGKLVGQYRAALVLATNDVDAETSDNPLVRSYYRFESEHAQNLEDRFSVSEARSVRWIVIYGMFQMLASLLSAAPEVEDSPYCWYPLCCTIPESAPSSLCQQTLPHPQHSMAEKSQLGNSAVSLPSPTIEVHPDVDASSYYSPTSPSISEMSDNPLMESLTDMGLNLKTSRRSSLRLQMKPLWTKGPSLRRSRTNPEIKYFEQGDRLSVYSEGNAELSSSASTPSLESPTVSSVYEDDPGTPHNTSASAAHEPSLDISRIAFQNPHTYDQDSELQQHELGPEPSHPLQRKQGQLFTSGSQAEPGPMDALFSEQHRFYEPHEAPRNSRFTLPPVLE